MVHFTDYRLKPFWYWRDNDADSVFSPFLSPFLAGSEKQLNISYFLSSCISTINEERTECKLHEMGVV